VETARDLACAELWQASLERSLARRGRPTRSSLELFHLQPERDLSRAELLRESAMYSQLRRSAATRRPSMALPGAGGISALALLAATTLPSLLSGRGGSVRTTRVTYRADEHDARPSNATVSAANATAAARPAALPGTATGTVTSAAAVPAHAVKPRPSLPPAHAARAPAAHHAHPAIRAAHIAAAGDVTGGAASGASSVSGGAAPTARHSVAATTTHTPATVHSTPTVHRTHSVHRAPSTVRRTHAVHKAPSTVHPRHAHTGGGAVEEATTVGHPRSTSTPVQPKPVSKPHPVATTPPASTPAPAPPPAVSPGHYANPLAGAHVSPERIDQGVDYAGSGPLGAIGDGKVTYVGTSGTGWPGAFIEYQLTDGPDAGRYVYYAEGISPAPGLHVGQTVQAGQTLAQIIAGDAGGIEIGWGAGIGTETYAMQHGQWHGGDDANSVPSPAGKDFSALIAQLGGPPGKVEG